MAQKQRSPTGNKRTPDPRAGFTLVELTIVVFVLALTVGLCLPKLSAMFSEQRGNAFADALARMLGKAQTQALLSGQTWEVVLDFSRGEILLRQAATSPIPLPPGASSSQSDTMRRSAADSDAKKDEPRQFSEKLPEGYTLVTMLRGSRHIERNAQLIIGTRPNGLADPCLVHLTDSERQNVLVTVEPVGAHPLISDGGVEETISAYVKANPPLAVPTTSLDAASLRATM